MRWLFLHHFCQGFGEALFLAVADALFLLRFPHAAPYLALAFMAASGLLIFTGQTYAWLEHKLPPKRLMPLIVLVLVGLVVVSRLGLAVADVPAMAFALLVIHRVIYQFTNLEFWGVSALLLDVRQGKRLFGIISIGDMPAKLLGFLLVAALSRTTWLPDLLWLSAAAFMASLLVLRRLVAHPVLTSEADDHGAHAESHAATAPAEPGAAPTRAGLLLRWFGSPLIAALAGLSFLAVMAITWMEFNFLEGAQAHYTSHGGTHAAADAGELTRFLGLFLGLGTFLTILAKPFMSARLIERLGVRRALLLTPLTLVVLAVVTAVVGLRADETALFFAISATWLVAETLKFTIHSPLFLALFQPLNRRLRLLGHTRVKGLVDPLGLGVAGAVLWGLLQWQHGHLAPALVNQALVVVLIGWVLMVLVVNRYYLHTLNHAVRRRFLEGGQVAIRDRGTLQVLRAKLASPHPEEVIYALELLSASAAPDLPETLTQLLHHPVAEVQCRALEKMDARTLSTAQAEVLTLAAEPTAPRVRAAAVRALSQLADDAAPPLLPFLEDPDPTVRGAAITGLLRSGGLEAVVLAGQQLLRLVEAPDPGGRALAAQVIGELRVRNFYQPLEAMLRDPDAGVRRRAVAAAGLLANERLLPLVLPHLTDPVLADEAARAITLFGPAALDTLAAGLQAAPNAALARPYAEIIGRIGGPQAEALLLDLLTTAPDQQARQGAVRALLAMKYQAPARGAAHDALLGLLDQQLAHAVWCLRAEQALVAEAAFSPTLDAVWMALLEEGRTARERLFTLIELLCEPRTVRKVRSGLEAGQRELVANALEVLDHLLPKRQAAPVALLLEPVEAAEKLRLLATYFPSEEVFTVPAVLDEILRAGTAEFHRWTVATVLRALPDLAEPALLGHRRAYAANPDKLLHQIAAAPTRRPALLAIDAASFVTDSADDLPMHTPDAAAGELLEIEKVLVLKSTSVFADTPEHVLVDIAAILREQRVAANQDIFLQGDLGDSMYVIYHGDVRIHAAGTTFATLHNREVFGELALLDPEPRSATATTTTDSFLLRLDQEAFYELMAERREVAQGILRMLARRIRNQNHLLAELRNAR